MLRPILYSLLVLTMCHVCLFEECYFSTNWRLRSKVERPFMFGKHQHGVFTVKRGVQTLQGSSKQQIAAMQHTGNAYNLLFCRECTSKMHNTSQCPLLQCMKCHEFGHVASTCKKTLIL
jgi:hypothetical protein